MNTIPRTFHPSHRVLPLLLHLLQNTKKMHLYNAWLPPPVAQETKREKDSFSRVVCSVKNSYKPDDPDSVYSTLKWISVIDLWAFFNFLCSFLFMFFLFQSYQFVFDLGSFFFSQFDSKFWVFWDFSVSFRFWVCFVFSLSEFMLKICLVLILSLEFGYAFCLHE